MEPSNTIATICIVLLHLSADPGGHFHIHAQCAAAVYPPASVQCSNTNDIHDEETIQEEQAQHHGHCSPGSHPNCDQYQFFTTVQCDQLQFQQC